MIPPAVATTQRLFTPLRLTRPTFSAYAVYGKVLKMPPSAEERPSARRPPTIVASSASLPTISPTAIRSPVVSIIDTIITISIVTTTLNAKVGAPKWKGAGRRRRGVADPAEVREPERDRDERADDDADHDRRALDPLVARSAAASG